MSESETDFAVGALRLDELVESMSNKLYNTVEKFCSVERTAYAEFEGIGPLEQYFGVFLR